MKQSSSLPHFAYLTLILVAGLLLRTWNVNFDRGIGSHPDERSTACFYAPTIQMPASWDEFWDPKQSPLNPLWDRARGEPRSFTYGHFPLYLGVATGRLLHLLSPVAAAAGMPQSTVELLQRADSGCDALAVAGRLTIALLDMVTIFLIFLLGALIFDRATGLIAATLYAATAQAIQLSHFFAMDPASTTFTVLAVLAAVRFVYFVRVRDMLLLGIAVGLAVASKFSALPILVLPVVASALVWARTTLGIHARRTPGADRYWAVVALPLTVFIAGATFFAASPYAVLDWQQFVQATLVEQGRMVRGVADFPFTRQYRNSTPYLYFIAQQVTWGMWWPLGLLGFGGAVLSLVFVLKSVVGNIGHLFRGGEVSKLGANLSVEYARLLANRSNVQVGLIVVWSWVLPYFTITGAFLAKFNRYMSPLLPFLALFAAATIYWLHQASHKTQVGYVDDVDDLDVNAYHITRPMPLRAIAMTWAARVVAAIAIGSALFWSIAYVHGVYGNEHTWITASRWIYAHAPRGSVILWELWDDPLPKAIPGEPGMDMGEHDLRNIDWGPYEEDTVQKYEQLKAKLREADFVVYSSKRIYDSVDELPERYPMTLLYYEAMWDGRLGYDLVADITSPPRLFGFEFDDRHADESWSLYDHPQVSIFEKKRQLTDSEFDALFNRVWEQAVPYYRGKQTAMAPLLRWLGLGRTPDSEHIGILNYLIALVSGRNGAETSVVVGDRPSLMLDTPLHQLPVVDNYRWNDWASNSTLGSIVVWWSIVVAIGWAGWPLCFALFSGLRDRGFLVSKTVGWLLAGWLLWSLASYEVAFNSVRNSWLALGALALLSLFVAIRLRRTMGVFLRMNWGFLLVSEILVLLSFLFVIGLRLNNPDLWQPWYGGEKFMEFAFLNGILRSPTFPPVDPHFAGGYINYYYFGLYLSSFLIKLTGIYAEVAFNLLIATLFALAFANAYAIAYCVGSSTEKAPNSPSSTPGSSQTRQRYRQMATALLAPVLVLVVGNLDGFAQVVRGLSQRVEVEMQSVFAIPAVLFNAGTGLVRVATGTMTLPGYDFWGPSRVVPFTINEFPYWSFLFADLHPHLIGIPLSLLFLYLAYAALRSRQTANSRGGITLPSRVDAFEVIEVGASEAARSSGSWLASPPNYSQIGHISSEIPTEPPWPQEKAKVEPATEPVVRFKPYVLEFVMLTLAFAFMLGALASVNLWELPTYFAVGLLVTCVRQYYSSGRIVWRELILFCLLFLAGAYLFYYPFFAHYVNIGAAGIGLVKEPDDVGVWMLVWGLFVFVLSSWLFLEYRRSGRYGEQPNAIARILSLIVVRFDRLPRIMKLHTRLVRDAQFGYLFGLLLLAVALAAVIVALVVGYAVLALCILGATLSMTMLWRHADGASRARPAARKPVNNPVTTQGSGEGQGQYIAILIFVGFSILGGTEVLFLRDFLQGGDWYRMNTIFKFYNQAWVLWGVASALALPILWRTFGNGKGKEQVAHTNSGSNSIDDPTFQKRTMRPANHGLLARTWTVTCVLLLGSSMAFPIFGTPARLAQRLTGWQPAIGTLNSLDYMRNGAYTWPDSSHTIELRYDYDAIRWILDNIRGNVVVVEAAEVEYYRAGGTRVASMTGLSGLRGMHESEQRYGDVLAARESLHREFWSTPDIPRTIDIIQELSIGLIYVGPLERQLHSEAMSKLDLLAADGVTHEIYRNPQVTLFAVTDHLSRSDDGTFAPIVGAGQ